MKLPLHPFFRYILRHYNLTPTQLVPNPWSQLAGAFLLWKEVTLGEDMPLHIFQTPFQPRTSSGGSKWWYCMKPWGSHSPFIWGTPTIKNSKSLWFWIKGREPISSVKIVDVKENVKEEVSLVKWRQDREARSVPSERRARN
ncbi:unnamed protein product [Fraxinus pennsylvanica]|uniref:Transposase (putative) gypsy type domain-containing protein n=1 Tax=Fraxinus pennsylvanica TaxID=56036 RepID=A0AAD2EG71_9LAMI|nr:unnamed protein product [Fraxinus pennsylvanica]